jgi:hypothetical protein
VLRRLLPLVAASIALSLTAGCADDVSPAARIGDIKISDDDLLAEVAEWAANPAAVDPAELAGQAPGTFPQQLVGAILQQRIDLELHAQEFEELGLELTSDLRADALSALFGGDPSVADEALGGFSEDFATSYVDDITMQIAVESELGQEAYLAWRTAALSDSDIEISPRYGSWDADAGTVVGPEGPVQPAPSASPLAP